MGERISRRKFLRFAGGASLFMLAACATSPTPTPTPTEVPTVTPTLTPVPTPTETPYPTLQHITPEVHNVLEGLKIETYKVNTFRDITSEFSSTELVNMHLAFENRTNNGYLSLNGGTYISDGIYNHALFGNIKKNAESNVYDDAYFPYSSDFITVFYSDTIGKAYAGFGRLGDQELLDWSTFNGTSWSFLDVNKNGKVVYELCDPQRHEEIDRCDLNSSYTAILADIINGTKTVIRITDGIYRHYEFSGDGNSLLIWDLVKGNIDVLNLKDWSLNGHVKMDDLDWRYMSGYSVYVNHDGTKIIYPSYSGKALVYGKYYPTFGYTVEDLASHTKKIMGVPDIDGRASIATSPAFDYVAITTFPIKSPYHGDTKTGGEPQEYTRVDITTPHGLEEIYIPRHFSMSETDSIVDILDNGALIAWYRDSKNYTYFEPDKDGKYTTFTTVSDGKESTEPIPHVGPGQ